ncbi:hypothetical protein FQN55_009246 [Onygenales sp. PD_40]|nr:hypothetical protein FQN55_009246 [Onygenales sp. PD_40]KAK2798672.1 hypothetical protein FQN51_007533 [Onygenales sp. PD_10]
MRNPPARLHPIPFKLPENDEDSNDSTAYQIQPPIVVPSFQEITTTLVERLRSSQEQSINHIPYAQVIAMCGGVEPITSALVACIDPHVKALEDRVVTPRELNGILNIQCKEANPWPSNSGYMNFVTDLRNDNYWRPYVGQSEKPRMRIQQHTRNILALKRDTLHYYIVWKGNGQRTCNFIRLWTLVIPEGKNTDLEVVFNNILEMVMTRAFESLPSTTLEEWFGLPEGRQSFSGVGLNVIPPLLQGRSLSPFTRHTHSLRLEDCQDPEIQGWPKVRKNFLKENSRSSTDITAGLKPELKAADYHCALRDALQNHPNHHNLTFFEDRTHPPSNTSSISPSLGELASRIDGGGRGIPSLHHPFGNTQASIGIILDWVYPKTSPDSERHTDNSFDLPWGLKEMGFSNSNSLIWPFDLRQGSTTTTHKVTPLSPSEIRSFSQLHRDLIQNSGLKVVIMCSLDAERDVVPDNVTGVDLNIRGYTFKAFLEIDSLDVKRVYIHMPTTLTVLWANKWSETRQLGEVFRFASVITNTQGISPYFYNNSLAHLSIIRRYRDEESGIVEKMTRKTIDLNFRDWLNRKGFIQDEHIDKLESLAGSLVEGLLILLHVLPTRPLEYRQPGSSVPRSKVQRRGAIEKEKLAEIKSLFRELNAIQGSGFDLETSKAIEPPEIMPNDGRVEKLRHLVQERKEEIFLGIQDDEERAELESTFQYSLSANGLVEAMKARSIDDETEQSGNITIDETGKYTFEFQESKANELFPSLPRKATVSKRELHTQMELLAGRKYRGTFRDHQRAVVFYVHGVSLRFYGYGYDDLKRGTESIIQAEIKPVGEKHPRFWAKNARDNDPAVRLGFRVRMELKSGEMVEQYPNSGSEEAPMVANGFIDWMEGLTDEQIAANPRRYVNVHANVVNLADSLKPFVGGNYTDDYGNPVPKENPGPPAKRRKTNKNGQKENS